jgi:hypothetical protein
MFGLCYLADLRTEERLILLGQKGITSLKSAAFSRGEFDRQLHFVDGCKIHEKCRNNNTNKRNIEQCFNNK